MKTINYEDDKNMEVELKSMLNDLDMNELVSVEDLEFSIKEELKNNGNKED